MSSRSRVEAAAPLQHQRRTLHLLTLNFLLRPPMINYNGDDYKDERMEIFVRDHMHKFDIICMQEVFGLLTDRRDRLIQRARAKGFRYHVMSPAAPWWPPYAVDGGLLILSRLPITASDWTVYPRGINADVLAQKGAIYARVQLERGGHFHVFTTHLQADYAHNNEGLRGWRHAGDGNAPNRAVRLQQVARLASFVREKTSHDDCPIFLMGDMNVNSRSGPEDGADSPEYRGMLDAFANGGFTVVDHLCAANGGVHPITICDSEPGPGGVLLSTEPQLTPSNEHHLRRSIDYVLTLERTVPPSPGDICQSLVIPISSPMPSPSSDRDADRPRVSLMMRTCGPAMWGASAVTSAACIPVFWLCGTAAQHGKQDEDAGAAPHPDGDVRVPLGRPLPAPVFTPAPGVHTCVEKFEVDSAGKPFKHLSDHYGVVSMWQYYEPEESMPEELMP